MIDARTDNMMNLHDKIAPYQTRSLGERVRSARKRNNFSQSQLARKVGVSVTTIQNYESSKFPKGEHAVALSLALNCSLDWLLTGSESPASSESTAHNGCVPVIGLAKCGLQGWAQSIPLGINASRPGDLTEPEAFCVLAVGNSMTPAGILPGQICYCNPHDDFGAGDAVYVERRDGTATIKLFRGSDNDRITLQGWLDPDENGRQAPYTDTIKTDQVRRMATVIYVKRKL